MNSCGFHTGRAAQRPTRFIKACPSHRRHRFATTNLSTWPHSQTGPLQESWRQIMTSPDDLLLMCVTNRGNNTCFHPSSTFTAYTNMFFPNDSICKFSNPPNECISLQTHHCPSSQRFISLSSKHTSSGTSNKAFLNYRSHTGCRCCTTQGSWTCCFANRCDLWLFHRPLCVCVCMFVCTYEERCVFFHKFTIRYSFIYIR